MNRIHNTFFLFAHLFESTFQLSTIKFMLGFGFQLMSFNYCSWVHFYCIFFPQLCWLITTYTILEWDGHFSVLFWNLYHLHENWIQNDRVYSLIWLSYRDITHHQLNPSMLKLPVRFNEKHFDKHKIIKSLLSIFCPPTNWSNYLMCSYSMNSLSSFYLYVNSWVCCWFFVVSSLKFIILGCSKFAISLWFTLMVQSF